MTEKGKPHCLRSICMLETELQARSICSLPHAPPIFKIFKPPYVCYCIILQYRPPPMLNQLLCEGRGEFWCLENGANTYKCEFANPYGNGHLTFPHPTVPPHPQKSQVSLHFLKKV